MASDAQMATGMQETTRLRAKVLQRAAAFGYRVVRRLFGGRLLVVARLPAASLARLAVPPVMLAHRFIRDDEWSQRIAAQPDLFEADFIARAVSKGDLCYAAFHEDRVVA